MFDDNTWVGVDVYAVFTWRPSGLLSNLDPETSSFIVCFHGNERISHGHEYSFHGRKDSFHAQVPLVLDGIFGSEPHQLVVMHVPRLQFSPQIFSQSGHIWAYFRVSMPDHVSIDVCGMRLVYKQDLRGLIDTITECILRSPDVFHRGYYRDFSRFVSEAEIEVRAG